MTTELATPTFPSVEPGTPPKRRSEAVFLSSPTEDTPARPLEIPGKADTTIEKLREAPQVTQIKKSELHVSLPSTELKGAQPSERTGGVGALPGNLSESSVALLPDERQERAQERRSTSPRQRRDTLKPSAAGEGEEHRGFESESSLSMNEPTESSDAPLESAEAKAVETVESDVAAMSGPEVESQDTGETKSQEAPSEQQRSSAVTAAGGTLAENSSDLASEQPKHKEGSSQDVQEGDSEEARKTRARTAEGGYGGDYHPAQLHPPPPGASVAEYQSPAGGIQQEQDVSVTTGETAGAAKKPGFMTMVKGEMKIFAGKISGDEHRVEEGKKLVHGSA